MLVVVVPLVVVVVVVVSLFLLRIFWGEMEWCAESGASCTGGEIMSSKDAPRECATSRCVLLGRKGSERNRRLVANSPAVSF